MICICVCSSNEIINRDVHKIFARVRLINEIKIKIRIVIFDECLFLDYIILRINCIFERKIVGAFR